MKRNNVNYCVLIATFIASIFIIKPILADRIIGFYFVPYPGDAQHAEKFSNKLQKPGRVAKCMLEGYACYSQVAGIFASYAGYIAHSDIYGFIDFPKKQDQAQFHIIITPHVTPIFMLANTVSHFQTELTYPVATYLIEQKKDHETKMLYWDVNKIENPADRIIPLDTILIIADPDDIVVPTGITLAQKSPNIILPDIYVKKGIQATKHAMYMLNMNFLFGPVKEYHKKGPKRLVTLVD